MALLGVLILNILLTRDQESLFMHTVLVSKLWPLTKSRSTILYVLEYLEIEGLV